MRASPEDGVALRPPNGSRARCTSVSCDLRVSGSAASASRLAMAAGSTPASSAA
jgi:hypothetical protein